MIRGYLSQQIAKIIIIGELSLLLHPNITKVDYRFKDMKVKIQTMLGDIVVRLYDETPIHRDNFVKLVKERCYDGTLAYDEPSKQP